jgi:hypothetical protein
MAEADIPPIIAADLDDVLNKLRKAASDPEIHSIIISSEYFSICEPILLNKLLTEIHISNITALIVLRRQDRYIESNYNQLIKMMRWVIPIGKAAYHSGYDWYLLLSSWARVFSKENLRLDIYDNLAAANSGIVAQIFGDLHPALARLAAEHPTCEERSNPSLPAALIEFKRLANRAAAYDVLQLVEKASQRGLGGPPFRMKPELAKGFLDIYRESNRKVAQEFFHRDGDLFDESDLEGDPMGADYTGNVPIETLALLLALHISEHAKQSKELKDAVETLEAKVELALAKLRQRQDS